MQRSRIPATLALSAALLCGGNVVAAPDDAEPGAETSRPTATGAVPAAEEPATADALRLFEEGKALAAEKRYALACEKFEESAAQKPGIGVRFHLADCFEHVGRSASAHALFLEIAAETRRLGQADREQAARARASALEPRLSRVKLSAPQPASGLQLELDGRAIDAQKLSTPVALDPGEHVIAASAPGKKPWSMKLRTTADQPGTLLVQIPELTDEAARVAAAPQQQEPLRDERSDGTRRAIAVSLAGAGALSLVAGVAMAKIAVANNQDAQAICPASVNCTAGEVELHTTLVDDARQARNFAYVGIGTGVVALGLGAYLLLTDSDEKRRSQVGRLRAEPLFSPREGRIGGAVSGSF